MHSPTEAMQAMLLLNIKFVCEDFGKQQWDKKHILLLVEFSNHSLCGKESL